MLVENYSSSHHVAIYDPSCNFFGGPRDHTTIPTMFGGALPLAISELDLAGSARRD